MTTSVQTPSPPHTSSVFVICLESGSDRRGSDHSKFFSSSAFITYQHPAPYNMVGRTMQRNSSAVMVTGIWSIKQAYAESVKCDVYFSSPIQFAIETAGETELVTEVDL
ncbi:hypothetical protein Tcan_14507 [Toxocara canis]|uniref:Uncharacterized protein n=1 Tax=Toxocara canis TaxID=6265 RepID=A0A0B2V8G4_TOXCA|nr:hypothetical protein Tcan_14507 [Toxocara canis]